MYDVQKKYLKEIKNKFSNSNKTDIVSSDWPKSWSTIDYKKYTRFQKIPLVIGSEFSNDLKITDSLKKRESGKKFKKGNITFESLSNILYFSVGKKPNSEKRFYPSAGSRYPLEIYVIINVDMDALKKGLYHYNVLDNCLEFMWVNPDENFLFTPFKEKNNSSVHIVATSIIERSQRKYGNHALKFSFLETGCALQNVSLLCASFDINSSLINPNDVILEKFLEIDGEKEFITGQIALDF